MLTLFLQDNRDRRCLEVQEPEQGRVSGWQQNSDGLGHSSLRARAGMREETHFPRPADPPLKGWKLTTIINSSAARLELHRVR